MSTESTAALSQSLTLPCGAVLPNRLFKSAMTEGLADAQDRPTKRHNQLYKTWSQGGCGLHITGNVMIDRRFLERPGNVVIDQQSLTDGSLDALRAWAKAGTVGGNHLWMQISHPGRQVQKLVSSQPLAPSAVQLKIGGMFAQPKAMTEADILDAIQRYAFVAKIAKETGFTGVQIHAAHGYLISEFLSPVVNQRTDQWGGPIENRARLLIETIRCVRTEVGDDFPIAIKLNSSDFQKGGFSLDDCAAVAGMLNDEKLDFLEISGGSYEQPKLLGGEGDTATAAAADGASSDGPQHDENGEPLRESTRKREAYFMQYVPKIRAAFKGPIGVTGGFRQAQAMNDCVASGDLDAIGLARPLCVLPDGPKQLMDGSISELPRSENNIRLGSGLFGPNSPVHFFKMINHQLGAYWCYRQILLLAEGKPANPSLGNWRALFAHTSTELGVAKRRKS